MGRKDDRDRDSEMDEYRPPLDRATPISPDLARMEEGRPLPSGQHPLNQPLNHRRSDSALSYDSYLSAAGERRRGHGFRDAVTGLGAFGFARNIFKSRRERKEQHRLDAQRQREIENERQDRAKNQRYTGDGIPRRGGRRGSLTASTDLSTSIDDRPRYDTGRPPPVQAGTFPVGAASVATATQERSRQQNPLYPSNPVVGAPPVTMPPIPPDPQGIFHPESSGSEAYVSAGGRSHRRHSGRHAAAVPAPTGTASAAMAGTAAHEASSSRHERHQSGSGGSVASPPVSVKVKMHSDGRHVTLRRLPEEEAAAERRRRSRDRHGHRRRGSFSSLSDTNGSGDRWRRTEALERQQADEMRIESENLAAARRSQANIPLPPLPLPQTLPVPLPPPPPGPPANAGLGPPRPGTTGSVGSPGTYDGTATEASADYASNRRRRRAERAQAKQAREARSGAEVEYS